MTSRRPAEAPTQLGPTWDHALSSAFLPDVRDPADEADARDPGGMEEHTAMDSSGESTARDEVTTSSKATPAAPATAANVARNVALNGQRSAGPTGDKARKGEGEAGVQGEAAEEHDGTWIYQQLGLSPEAYQGDRPRLDRRGPSGLPPVGRRPVAGAAAGRDFDFADLAPGDPHDSPFPPGSLGRDEDMPTTGPKAKPFVHHQGASTAPIIPGSVPESAKPKPTEKPVAAEKPAKAAVEKPAERAATKPAAKPAHAEKPATPVERPRSAFADTAREAEHNPFEAYDERERTGDFVLPPLPPLPPSLRAAEASRARSWDDGPLAAEDRTRVTSDSLTAEKVLKGRKAKPTRGWRRGLLSMGVNLGPSGKELAVQELEERVRTPIQGCHRLAVISLKGGVGKTTTIAAMGSMFASLRGDRVIAVDANPDRGTLGEKIVGEVPAATVRDFVGKIPRLTRYADVREFIGQADSRLEVLASESDPMASLAFSEQDYRVISEVLERFYNLILTDCGTGLLHSAMVGVLAKAEQVVIVSSASLDGARSASATLDWLEAHGYQELARDSVSVISAVRVKADGVHISEIERHFASRTRAVVSIPYDEHLAEGGTIDLTALNPRTYNAYLELAATVGDAFARTVGY